MLWISNVLLITTLCYSENTFSNTAPMVHWTGTLQLSEKMTMDVAMEYHHTNGESKGLFHCVSQNAFDLKIKRVSIINQIITFSIPSLLANFQGKILNDSIIEGQLTQRGQQPWPIVFRKVEEFPFSKPYRPQEPKEIRSYDEKEVYFKNHQTGHTLAGTLTLPKSGTNFPTVVLLSGSGPNDRDQTIFGHRNFLVLAHYLTNAGIGVLRFDDRGVGESEGDFSSASVIDLAQDGAAAVDFLSNYPSVNKDKIGLLGHSLGAELAPMVAAQNSKVHFIVMMAGGAQPLYRVIIEQTEAIYREKVSPAGVALNSAILRALFDSLQRHEDLAIAKKHFESQLRQYNAEASRLTQAELEVLELHSPLTTEGFDHFFSPNWKVDLFYDPAFALSAITIPVFALNGTLDRQVSPDNLRIIEQRLKVNSQLHGKTKLYPGLNHLFQPAVTGMPEEYSNIPITIDENVVKDIIHWIKAQQT